jgi:EAL domain-containing protein (putative c-di-GMP-specific phosphodiesterase class I)
MEVVAEGVETADQLECLRAAGCDEVQGFYYARPMPADEFVAFIAPATQVVQAG